MNNKDIERNIVDVFEKIQPDQLQAILSDCKNNERRMIFMEEKRNNIWVPRLAALAASFVLVFGLMFGLNRIQRADDAVAATISLDVNPSIELKINSREKVLDVIAMNEDGRKIIDDMDFRGSDLKVTINALIGSLVRNGYLNEVTNSILVSVEDMNDSEAKALENELMEEISKLFADGSILAQQVNASKEVKEVAEKYGITLGKAQMIKELVDRSAIYTYDDLADLTINELNLLSKDIEESLIKRNGKPSDKAYIGHDKAKQIALADAGAKESEVNIEKVEIDYENRRMVYEVEFTYKGVEYEYVIDAENGNILEMEKEDDHKQSSAGQSNQNESGPYDVSKAQAKQVALNHAGVSADQISGYHIKKESDDGRSVYEIEFYVGNVEYEYEIDAVTGAILKADSEIDDDHDAVSYAHTGKSSDTKRYGDDVCKTENGTVYEYDDGKWEVEHDKKIENGIVYEYDDGKWEPDKKVENGVTYEYEDGHWEVDDDDDHDDDDNDDWDDDDDDDD
ncbi:MAG: PepSY domain-containing protein [Erysipelotrichaceae bacterium]|nr:PepSY domain-containing protein [Erysipelotrichaceae bacterium]